MIGGASCNAEEYSIAEAVGELTASRGGIVLCGGGRGVMEAVCKGVKKAGGTTIGIMPGSTPMESPPNRFVDIPIFTGMSDGRNVINTKSSDVVIAIGGSFGTLSEIGLALKSGKRVISINSWNINRDGVKMDNYLKVDSAEEAVELAFNLLKFHTSKA